MQDRAAATSGCVALSCLGALLGALPHFNFRKDLLTAVVPRVGSRDWAAGRACFDAVREVLANDPEGEATVEAVQLLADHIKRRRCVVHPRVVALLLYVEVDASLGSVEGAGKGRDVHGHRAKKLSRKAQKKANLKAGKDLGFEAAKARADRSNRARRQSQLLEAVFESLFRILKRYVGMPSTLGEERPPPAAAAGSAFDEELLLLLLLLLLLFGLWVRPSGASKTAGCRDVGCEGEVGGRERGEE